MHHQLEGLLLEHQNTNQWIPRQDELVLDWQKQRISYLEATDGGKQ